MYKQIKIDVLTLLTLNNITTNLPTLSQNQGQSLVLTYQGSFSFETLISFSSSSSSSSCYYYYYYYYCYYYYCWYCYNNAVQWTVSLSLSLKSLNECALKLTDLWIKGLFFNFNFLTGASHHHFNLFFNQPWLNLYIIFHMLYLHSCHMIRFFQVQTVSQDFTHFFTGLHQPDNSMYIFISQGVSHAFQAHNSI